MRLSNEVSIGAGREELALQKGLGGIYIICVLDQGGHDSFLKRGITGSQGVKDHPSNVLTPPLITVSVGCGDKMIIIQSHTGRHCAAVFAVHTVIYD